MRKEVITKEDGRLLTYYWFDRDGGSDSSASESGKTNEPLCTTDHAAADSPKSSS